jgi:hypothetical protein
MKPAKEHNYVKIWDKLVSDGTIQMKPGVAILSFSHDDWCDIYKKKFCNCDPDVLLNGELLRVGASS